MGKSDQKLQIWEIVGDCWDVVVAFFPSRVEDAGVPMLGDVSRSLNLAPKRYCAASCESHGGNCSDSDV